MRAHSVGVYRLWRDAGFTVGALQAGILADLVWIAAAIYSVSALIALSGVVVIVRMYETHPPVREGWHQILAEINFTEVRLTILTQSVII